VRVDNLAPSVALDMASAVETTGGSVFLGRARVEQTHTASATDPGSDDLTFGWSFGPVSTYFNDGVGPDSAQSPGGVFPFGAEDTAAATFDSPGVESLSVTVTDDDGGTAAAPFVELVTGAATCTQGQGFWKHQFSWQGSHQVDNPTLLAYLGVIDHASGFFSERVPATTLAQARTVMNSSGPGMRPKAQAQLLSAWLNFAHGAVGWDGTLDTPLHEVLAQAEAILLNPSASQQQLVRAKDLSETVGLFDPFCEPEPGDTTLTLQSDSSGACLLLNLTSGQYLWRQADGRRFVGPFIYAELGGRLLFLGGTGEPSFVLGIVTTRGRAGNARLLVGRDTFSIIDPNIDNNRACP
jgi:hypothetical protein